jgi:phosphatidylinositol 4-kinase
MNDGFSWLNSTVSVSVLVFPVNRMFGFPEKEVDFYLPQLVTMYIQMADVAEALHPYLIHRYAPRTSVRVLDVELGAD